MKIEKMKGLKSLIPLIQKPTISNKRVIYLCDIKFVLSSKSPIAIRYMLNNRTLQERYSRR